jgi:glucose/arabinose dehydrogenase
MDVVYSTRFRQAYKEGEMNISKTAGSMLLILVCTFVASCAVMESGETVIGDPGSATNYPVASAGGWSGRCNDNYVFDSRRGAVFYPGAQLRTCTDFILTFQRDGRLEIHDPARALVWYSDTQNRGASRLVLQPDGNLWMYAGPNVIWSSSGGTPGSTLRFRPNGDLTIYNQNFEQVWSTGHRRSTS